MRRHSLDFRERQIKTTMCYHYTTTRMTKMKKTKNKNKNTHTHKKTRVNNGVEQLELSNTAGNINWYISFRKPSGTSTKAEHMHNL